MTNDKGDDFVPPVRHQLGDGGAVVTIGNVVGVNGNAGVNHMTVRKKARIDAYSAMQSAGRDLGEEAGEGMNRGGLQIKGKSLGRSRFTSASLGDKNSCSVCNQRKESKRLRGKSDLIYFACDKCIQEYSLQSSVDSEST